MTRRIGSKVSNWLLLMTGILATSAVGIPLQVSAQDKASPLAFEVVSVKVNKPGERREFSIRYLPGGRLAATGVPIPLLILEAYDLPRLDPSPEFLKLDRGAVERDLYDIEAIAPVSAIPPGSSARGRDEKIKEMLQTLLEDRFKLRLHHEKRETLVYAIVVARNGPRFGSAELCADRPTDYLDPASCHSMADLVRFGSRVGRLDRPLVDKTGLTELYSIPSVDWAAILPGAPGQSKQPGTPGTEPDQLFSDILDRLGLRLESQKAIVDMVLIDHVEPLRSEN